jgi:predicted YcjX-like family ATPase
MTDQPQEAARSAGGRGEPDRRHLAARRRDIERKELLERLRQKGLIEQVIETAERLADESIPMDAVMVSRLRAANEARMKLVGKYLPDVKAVEMTGEDGGPVVVEAITRKIIDPRGS